MTKKKLKYFRGILLKKRDETLNSIDYLSENLQNTQIEQNESHKQFDHLGDIDADIYDQSNLIVLINREKKYLQQIQNALNEMDTGKYGICKICGEKIMEARLEAVPTTNMCIICKQKQKNPEMESNE